MYSKKVEENFLCFLKRWRRLFFMYSKKVEEMDEKNEKTFDDEDKKTQNGTSGENGDLAVEDEEEVNIQSRKKK